MKLAHPYRFDARGRTAEATDAAHVRGLIEQVLFTAPGERVMRPDFGSGARQLLFAPNSDTLAAVVQMSVQAALNQWLGQQIVVDAVAAESRDATLTLTVRYSLRLTGETREEVFTR
jgi:phage baseplate assembly protein W